MFKKSIKFRIFVITILISMVFAVNLGFTFAQVNTDKVDYTLEVNSDASPTEDRSTYLNDVVVNNSTKTIPIAYTLGTVQREINFDYSFSEDTDIAVTYELKYTDGTEVNNVILNIVNRDNYIWDQEIVQMDNYTPAYNASSDSGTLYSLNTISAGSGNIKLFSGVTFLTGNNKVDSYISSSPVTVGYETYEAGDAYAITSVEYQYTQLDISRYWEKHDVNSLGQAITYICRTGYTMAGVSIPAGVIMYADDFDSYIESGAGLYTVTYTAISDILSADESETLYLNQSTLTKDQVDELTASQRAKIKAQCALSGAAYWSKKYKCKTDFAVSSTNYVAGTVYTVDQYNTAITANSNNVNNFETVYTTSTSYIIKADNVIVASAGSNNIGINKSITSEEYSLLLPSEQACFIVKDYKTFKNKNLTIDVSIHTAVKPENVSGYTEDHFFKTLKKSTTSKSFSIWLQYKKNNGSVTENVAMIYNGHARFENSIPYSIDFSSTENMSATPANDKSNLTSSYIYKQTAGGTHFYSYAGGNKFNAGIGVYYLTSSSNTKLTVQVNASWYNSNGTKISSMPINNINLQYNGSDEFSFVKNLSANSHGYIDVLAYIQTITEGDLYDMTGYSLVVSSVTAVFETATETPTATSSSIQIINSTSYNPILYTLSEHQRISPNLEFNITITNNSSSAIAIPTVTLDPTFTAYNGSTSISTDQNYGYGVANTVEGSNVVGFEYLYDSSVWSVSGNVFTGTGYIAPYTSLVVVSGVCVPAQSTNFWAFDLGGSNDKSFYADYWFEVGVSYTASESSVSYNAVNTYSSAEIMTSLTHTSESTEMSDVVSYIAIRNNTLQTISEVNYEGILQLAGSSSDVTYTVESDGTVTIDGINKNKFTINLTGLTLYPGESIFICKLTIAQGQSYDGDYSVKLTSSFAKAKLVENATANRTGIYFKRDFASGNLSIINANTSGTEQGLQINGLSGLIGGSTKWNSSNKFIMQDTDGTLAKFRNGQIINLLANITSNLSGYTYSNVELS